MDADPGVAERTLVITREFDAPRSLVFQAWTDPAHAARWGGPDGYTASQVAGELRPGGRWRACLRRDADGLELWQGGTYREVVPPERLVFTFAWDREDGSPGDEMLVTVLLAEAGGRTRMTFRQEGFATVAMRDGHAAGWASAFDRLAGHLTGRSGRETMDEPTMHDEAAIRGLVDEWRSALRARDAEALLAHHAPDFLAFDLAPPLATRGPDVAGTRAWLDTWNGPIDCEVRDLAVTVADGLAYSTSLNRMRGTKTDGTRVDLWVRATIGYRKSGGRWTIAHEHVSVPFHMDGSERAALELRP